MKSILYFVILISTIGFMAKGCAQEVVTLKMDIYQNVLLATTKYGYEIEDNYLRVYEESIYDNSGEYTEIERVTIFNKKLNKQQIAAIISKINELDIFQLDSAYIEPALDGTFWDFQINIDHVEKKILVDNTYNKQLSELVTFINTLIPNKKQFIEIKNYR